MHHADAERNRVVRRLDRLDLAVDQNLTIVGAVEAIGELHRSGLAGAILPYDSVDCARTDRNAHTIVGQDFTETLGDVPQ
jgi:hypothetical protein